MDRAIVELQSGVTDVGNLELSWCDRLRTEVGSGSIREKMTLSSTERERCI